MPFVTINHQQLYYTQPNRAGERRAVILIHGAGGNHLVWPKEIQRLGNYNVYNLDLPGHGRSSSPGCNSIDDYVEYIQRFMEILSLEKPIIIGHSMGGAIAQSLAIKNWPQIMAIILVATSSQLHVSPMILNAAETEPSLAANLITRYSWASVADQRLKDRSRNQLLSTDPTVFTGDLFACHNFDSQEILGKIQIPTLIISGSEDRMTPAEDGRILAEKIPSAQFVIIAGAGHYVMLENPSETVQTISQFIDSLP